MPSSTIQTGTLNLRQQNLMSKNKYLCACIYVYIPISCNCRQIAKSYVGAMTGAVGVSVIANRLVKV